MYRYRNNSSDYHSYSPRPTIRRVETQRLQHLSETPRGRQIIRDEVHITFKIMSRTTLLVESVTGVRSDGTHISLPGKLRILRRMREMRTYTHLKENYMNHSLGGRSLNDGSKHCVRAIIKFTMPEAGSASQAEISVDVRGWAPM